jgi:hypothetical protein
MNNELYKSPAPNAGGSGRWTVFTDDNFHLHDASERDCEGSFGTYEEALAECHRIVTESLRHLYAPGMTAERLYEDYTDFGVDPFIAPSPRDMKPFSAWGYARERAKDVVAELEAADREKVKGSGRLGDDGADGVKGGGE